MSAAVITPATAAPAQASQPLVGALPAARCAVRMNPGDLPGALNKPPASYALPTGVTAPVTDAAFETPAATRGQNYLTGPARDSCVTTIGFDVTMSSVLTAPGATAPSFEAVYGRGEATAGIENECGWFPGLRARATAAHEAQDCNRTPPGEQVHVLAQVAIGQQAAVITVPTGVKDANLGASPTPTGGRTAAVVLPVFYGFNGTLPVYSAQWADCQLTTSTAASCIASLQTFAAAIMDERIAQSGNGAPAERVLRAAVISAVAALTASTPPIPSPTSPGATPSGTVALSVTTDPDTVTDGRPTPSTQFRATVTGQCADGSAATLAVRSEVTGQDVTPPVLTQLPKEPSSFYVGQVGRADVEARCNGIAAARLPITVFADEYVALGDSYASGEGDSPDSVFLPGTVGPAPTTKSSTGCHRSPNAWSYTVAKLPLLDSRSFDFVACSGAVISDIYDSNNSYYFPGHPLREYEPPQLFSVDSQTTKLATLSIGGNNVGFSDIVSACVIASMLNYGPCDESGTKSEAETNLNALEQGGYEVSIGSAHQLRTLSDVYVDVASRLAHNGILVVAGYPQLFSTSAGRYHAPQIGAPAVCSLGNSVVMTKHNALWIDSLATAGNAAIARQVDAARARLAATRPDVDIEFAGYDVSFAGHRICDANSYLNGLRFDPGHFAISKALSNAFPYYQTSFHPNRDGQNAIANWVVGYTEAAEWDQAHPPATSVTQGSDTSVSAAGFDPDEPVTITLHSNPIMLGTFRASSTGVIQTRVRIPATLPSGAHEIMLIGRRSGRSQRFAITAHSRAASNRASLFARKNFAWAALAAAAAILAALAWWLRRRSQQPSPWPSDRAGQWT